MSNDSTQARSTFLRNLPVHIVRTLLGALLVFAGGAFFYEQLTGGGGGGEEHEGQIELIAAFVSSGYMMPLVKGTELVAGLLLLTNRFVAFGLLLAAPVALNIALFHFVLTPGHDVGISVFLLVGTAYLGWAYRSAWTGVFSAKLPIGAAPADPTETSTPSAAVTQKPVSAG